MDLITFKVLRILAKNAYFLRVRPSVFLSASLSACISLASSGRGFVKFDVGDFHYNVSKTSIFG